MRLSIERDPLGVRVIVGRFQAVIGYLNRFAVWWGLRPVIDLYPGTRKDMKVRKAE